MLFRSILRPHGEVVFPNIPRGLESPHYSHYSIQRPQVKIDPHADKLSTDYNEVRAEFKDLNTPVQKIDIDLVNKNKEAEQKAINKAKKDPKSYLKNDDYLEFSKFSKN